MSSSAVFQTPQSISSQEIFQPLSGIPARLGSGLAIASMVLGIISLVIGIASDAKMPKDDTAILSLLSVLSLVFGIVSVSSRRVGKGMAIAGIVTASLGILIILDSQ